MKVGMDEISASCAAAALLKKYKNFEFRPKNQVLQKSVSKIKYIVLFCIFCTLCYIIESHFSNYCDNTVVKNRSKGLILIFFE